ncbi:MAG TPA: hypothetical protein VJL58_06570, partial [Pyrinomonadaceae bacterium]|nr:hypothetical protein [Pyrinomonadaceae bacterium]
NVLEFCLEDGTRLISNPSVVTKERIPNNVAAETAVFGQAATPARVGFEQPVPDTVKELVPETFVQSESVSKALEVAPLVLALAHNWWQWLYLENQYVSSVASYILSANFLMWLVLLAAGVGISLTALKRLQNKAFAYISLVILAINLILFLVPRR